MIQASPEGGIVLSVRVIPRAPRSGVAGTRANMLLVHLHAPPVGGAANRELIDVIAAALDVPRRLVSIVAGDRSRDKRVRVAGIERATAESRLAGGRR
jgi:uncharacterized protein (TIGR00251 family)